MAPKGESPLHGLEIEEKQRNPQVQILPSDSIVVQLLYKEFHPYKYLKLKKKSFQRGGEAGERGKGGGVAPEGRTVDRATEGAADRHTVRGGQTEGDQPKRGRYQVGKGKGSTEKRVGEEEME